MSDSNGNVLPVTTYFHRALVKEGGLDEVCNVSRRKKYSLRDLYLFHCIGYYASSLTLGA
jgi:hypothetical protein